MLGKLKLFSKDKTEIPKSQLSKRTSSSSGFSSARSERSDSSISLNNDSNLPSSQTTSTSSTKSSSKKSDTAKSTTTTTKTSSKVPAPTKIATKGDKKDKSQLNGENNGITDSVPPTKMHKIPQAKLQVGRKPETTTTKTGSLPQPKSVQSPSVSAAIPKPMAAIKGTAKQTPSENGDADVEVIKVDKSSANGGEAMVQKAQIVAPMQNQFASQAIMTDSVNSNNHSNSSEASVIFRPADIYQSNPIPNRKFDNFGDSLLINGNKFATMKVNGMGQTSIATTIFEDDKEMSTLVPMRSLMRSGYSSCTTSPLRTNRIGNGFFDDNGQGYCSDGDALRKTSIRYSDIENGYLSEGPHFLSLLRNNRPQMPSTIAEER